MHEPSPNEHPGETLRRLMAKHQIDRKQLSAAIGVDIMRIYRILDRHMAVSADTAYRLGYFFETGSHYWLHQQAAYDLARLPDSTLLGVSMRVSEQRWQTLPKQNTRKARAS